MKFTDYLTRRIHPHARRSPHIDGMSRLLSFPNWPDVIESWPDLRDWLKQHNAQMDDYTTAERAWTSYKAFLKVEGLDMPKRPAIVCGLPRGVQALTDAPLLERLQDLNRQPRKIGKQIGDGKWQWYGDLTIPREFKIFRFMRDFGTLIQLSYYPDKSVRFPVLFARIADGVDPQQAYHEAERSTARVAPAVRPMRHSAAGMEAAP